MAIALPIDPVVLETPEITGAVFAVELTDTLSNFAVTAPELIAPVTASPTKALEAIVNVWLVPSWYQFTPSEDANPVKVLPLRVSFNQ